MNNIYLFPTNVQLAIDMITSSDENIVDLPATILSITPDVPPYVYVKTNKHIVKTKLGKLLTRHGYTNGNAKILVENYKNFNSNDFITKLSREFVKVYEHPLYSCGSTIQSCMTGMDCVSVYTDYDENIHLFLIYKEDTLVGRTLVRLDKKQYIRLYIDHNFITPDKATEIVNTAGYEVGTLLGLELALSYDYDNRIICPYLDGCYYVEVQRDSLLVTSSGISTSINGYIEECTCGSCGCNANEDDLYYIDGYDISVCASCLDDYVYFNDSYYHIDDCVRNNSTNDLVPEEYARNNLIEIDGNIYWDIDDCCSTLEGWYLVDDCVELVEKDNDGNRYAARENAIKIIEGDNLLGELTNMGLQPGWYLQEQLDELLTEN